jgi:hypothetical protein
MNYDEAYQWLVQDIFMSRFEKKIMERALNEIPIGNSEMLSDRYMLNYQKPKLLHIVLDVLIIQIQPTLVIKVRLSPLSTRRDEHIRNREDVSQKFLGSSYAILILVDFGFVKHLLANIPVPETVFAYRLDEPILFVQ